MSQMPTQIRWLTAVESKILEALFHNPPSQRIHDRAAALRFASQGYKTTQIVSLLGRDRSTVVRWIKDFNNRGTSSLACGVAR